MSLENLKPTAMAFINSVNNTTPGDVPVSAVLPPDYDPYASGMFQPMMPMYQPQPTDGISSAVSQISGGMGDEYTNRLLGALGLGDVGQYQMQQPVYQPMPFYNPYMNPYAGMFSPFMQPSGPIFDTTASNYMGGQYDPTGGNDPIIEGSLPSFGLMGLLSELFGGDSTPSTPTSSSSFDPTGDGSDYDTSSFDPTGDGSDYYS